MPFLSLNAVNIRFAEKSDLIWRNYIATELFSITKNVEFIDIKKLAKTTLDKNAEIFLVYVPTILAQLIHPSLEKKLGSLLADEVYRDLSQVL